MSGPGTAADEPPVRLARLLVSTVVGLSVLAGGLALVAYLFRDPLVGLGQAFNQTLGAPGVVLGYLLPDALTLPLPADLVAALALFGGTPFWTVCALGATGSVVGGAFGWLIGREVIGRAPRLRRRLDDKRQMVEGLRRSGPWVLAAAALTPLPFSIACWGVGALGMPFSTYFPISLLRIPRVILYLWLVQVGAVSIAGIG